MISIKESSKQSSADSFGAIVRRSEPTPTPNLAAGGLPNCSFYIDRLVEQINSPELKVVIGAVFQDLLRLLECVELVENYLLRVNSSGETLALFHLIHDEARKLVEFIRTDALTSDLLTQELADTLDGIAFALNHDLHRVFESGPLESVSDNSAQVVAAKLFRAHDVLINCLQQSTITLAMVFDRELIGAKLFNNSDLRYRQSIQLCQDLSELIELVKNYEELKGPSLKTLIDRIEKFRNESMECLMYSDWPQFEVFCDEIDLSKNHSTKLETVLDQFRSYLQALLNQVRIRNVLVNLFPPSLGEEDNCLV